MWARDFFLEYYSLNSLATSISLTVELRIRPSVECKASNAKRLLSERRGYNCGKDKFMTLRRSLRNIPSILLKEF
ncbi:hypothetical protein HN011_004907 [Eciton burchellii]|nr:hypothetical protein HN011_004907 [Eciton burchellii]